MIRTLTVFHTSGAAKYYTRYSKCNLSAYPISRDFLSLCSTLSKQNASLIYLTVPTSRKCDCQPLSKYLSFFPFVNIMRLHKTGYYCQNCALIEVVFLRKKNFSLLFPLPILPFRPSYRKPVGRRGENARLSLPIFDHSLNLLFSWAIGGLLSAPIYKPFIY